MSETLISGFRFIYHRRKLNDLYGISEIRMKVKIKDILILQFEKEYQDFKKKFLALGDDCLLFKEIEIQTNHIKDSSKRALEIFDLIAKHFNVSRDMVERAFFEITPNGE